MILATQRQPRCPRKLEKLRAGVWRLLMLTGVLCSSTLLASQNAAQAQQPTQYEVEAAYLYNFGKFVHWPPDPQRQTINICILGTDPFGATLDNIISDEKIDGLQLKTVRLSDTNSARSCAILFLGASEASHLDRDLTALSKMPVLTVSDMPDFVDVGGMIQFVLRDDRVRFEVNLGAVKRSGLVVSSQLLKVAVQIVDKFSGKGSR